MYLLKAEFRNIGPYGDNIHTIEYSQDGEIVQLKGKSGSGKSTILNLPKLIAFGKLDGVNKPHIANRVNKNGWVKGYVLGPNGKDEFIIERGFSPNSLTVYKNGVDIDNFGIRDAQKYIEEEIVQIPYSIFNNVISLDLNNFKGFLNLSPYEKKQIIDKIFNLELINDIYDLVKSDIKDITNNINSKNSIIGNINNTIEMSKEELVKLKETDDTKYNQQIKNDTEAITALNETQKTMEIKYKEFYDAYLKLNKSISGIDNHIRATKQVINDITKQINLFNKSKCPTCSTSFETDNYQELLKELNAQLTEQREVLQDYNAKRDKLIKINNEYRKADETYKNSFNDNKIRLRELNNNIRIHKDLIKNNKEFSSIQNIINENNKKLTTLQSDIEEFNSKLSTLYIMENLYSAEGIKRDIISSYIPVLNETLKEILISLSFPYTLEFDNNFDSTLYSLDMEVPHNTLSTGETKRVNVAVLCALLKIIKRKYPTVNCITLDETLSSLDIYSAESMITYLYTIAKEFKLTCFIVSHIPINNECITKNIVVNKIGGFSSYEVIDLAQ